MTDETPKPPAEEWTKEKDDARRLDPLERIADVLMGYDDEYQEWHGPFSRELVSLREEVARVAYAIEALVRLQDPCWRNEEETRWHERELANRRAAAKKNKETTP